MSATAKQPAFPLDCASPGCARPLQGPVKHCPYCGASSQMLAAPPVAPVKAVRTPPPPPPAVVVPAAAPAPAAPEVERTVTVLPGAISRHEPTLAAPLPARPRGIARKAGLAAVVLLAVGAYGAYQLKARDALQQFEADLAAGQDCLRASQFDCALEKADLALRADSKDPRAISLLQRAQAGQERKQRDEQDKATAAANLAKEKAAQQARREEQQREQAAQEKAAREQLESQQVANRQPVRSTPPANAPLNPKALEAQIRQQMPTLPKPTAAAGRAGATGQQLAQARSALSRGDGATARSLATRVLSQDPGNRQAQIILRQAGQLERPSSFGNKPDALRNVIIQ